MAKVERIDKASTQNNGQTVATGPTSQPTLTYTSTIQQADGIANATATFPVVADIPQVEWYRQCPQCWEKLHGVGVAYKTMPPENSVGVRYYRCNKCGLSFSRDFEIAYEVIEKRVITVIKR